MLPIISGRLLSMVRIAAAALCCAAVLSAAGGTEPKPKASEYAAHARAGAVEIGAEYLVHSFSGAGQMFAAGDYLVVEVALYPPRGETAQVSAGAFSLRINGSRKAALAQAPGFVAASLKYPDWEQRPTVVAGAGVGDTGVILGRPRQVERFPGDPAGRTRLPAPPRAPEPEDRSGLEKTAPATPAEVAVDAALPEGTARGPVSGYLYFAYQGKISKIKSLELLYTNETASAMLKLL